MGTENSKDNKVSFEKPKKRRRTVESMKYSDLIKVLDREVSLYVRLSDTDRNGICICATCGKREAWNKITLGHYISRSHHSVRFDERNIACQCISCNSFKGGEQFLMRKHLVKKYGEKEIEKMEMFAQMTKTETAETLREKIEYYRKAVKEIMNEKGLL